MAEFEDRLVNEPGRVTIRTIVAVLGDAWQARYWIELLNRGGGTNEPFGEVMSTLLLSEGEGILAWLVHGCVTWERQKK